MWPQGHVTDLRNDLKSNRKPKPSVFRGVRLGGDATCLELCGGKWIEQDKMGPPDPRPVGAAEEEQEKSPECNSNLGGDRDLWQ